MNKKINYLSLVLFSMFFIVGCSQTTITPITLSQNNKDLQGVKATQSEAVTVINQSDITYQTIADATIKIKTDSEITDFSAGMMDENGTMFHCYIKNEKISATEMNIDLCYTQNVKTILCISGKINNQELSYCYPLKMD